MNLAKRQSWTEICKAHPEAEKATFGAGCFWGVQHLFKQMDGVIATCSGYAGGSASEASYDEVKMGATGHAEVVQILFDPTKVNYHQLLEHFWRMHDPTQVNRQGADVGTQYRSVIFYHNRNQQEQAEVSRKFLNSQKLFDAPIATAIEAAPEFFSAEDFHQDFFERNGGHVCHRLRDFPADLGWPK